MEGLVELPIDVNKLCRTCMNLLQEEPTAQNTLFFENTATDLASQFINLTSLQILPDDGLPNVICSQCKESFSFVTEFKERCLKVNNTLLGLIHGQQIPDVKIEEDPLQIFTCYEPTCDYKTTVYYDYCHHSVIHDSNKDLTELHCSSQLKVSPSLTNNDLNYSEIKKLVSELPCDNENATASQVLQTIIEETKCCICSRQFMNKFQLSLHFLKHAALEESFYQDNENYFFCDFCGEVFLEKDELTEHNNRLHSTQEKLQWKCYNCEELFEDDINLLLHERTEDHFISAAAEQGTFKCLLCEEQYINVSNLLSHSVCHLINKYNCDHCQKYFISDDSLQNHLESHSHNNYPFTTFKIQIENDYKVDNSSDWNDHELSKSPENNSISSDVTDNVEDSVLVETYKCRTCRATFSSSAFLKRHTLLHKHQKFFSCTACDESFRWKYYLDRHMISKHKQVRNRMCTIKGIHKCFYVGCNTIFKSSTDLTNHIRTHSRSNVFVCDTCGRKLSGLNSLKKHMLIHTGQKPFPCYACNQQFRSKYYLHIHMVYKHKSVADKLNLKVKRHKCEFCEREFVQSSNLKRHIQRMHTGKKPFSCTVCNQGFKTKEYLQVHTIYKHRSLVDELNMQIKKCRFCEEEFVQSTDLRKHVLRLHSGEKPFTCIVCDQTFKMKRYLNNHLITKHKPVIQSNEQYKTETEEKRYKCTFPSCNRSFNTSCSLTRHICSHLKLKPYKCEICQKELTESSKLKKHMLIHTGEKPFSCHMCNQKFRAKHHVQLHIMSKHKPVSNSDKLDETQTLDATTQNQCETHTLHEAKALYETHRLDTIKTLEETQTLDETENLDETQATEKPFKCTYPNCNKSFNRSCNLTRHGCSHLNLKPYKCEICKKELTELTKLKKHMLIHTGERPFSCNQCNQTFRAKYHLRMHSIYKHKAKPNKTYKCEICQKRFLESSKLNKHMLIHTGEKPFSCQECNQKFRLKHHLQNHMISQHKEAEKSEDLDEAGKLYKCSHGNCEQIFYSLSNFSDHFRKHLEPTTRKKQFSDSGNLLNENIFSCNVCNQKFTHVHHLEQHVNSKHKSPTESDQNKTQTTENPYKCTYADCKKSFNTTSKLTKHLLVHLNIKLHKCKICERSFADSSNLKQHMLIHTGEKPFCCDICNEKFRRNQHLKLHTKNKHSEISESNQPDKRKAEKSEILNEMQTTEESHKCTYADCKKIFKTSSELARHLRTHLQLKPYKCETCKREFSDSKNLKRHLLIHTGEKPFSCDICNEKFRRKQHLQQHTENKHNKESESDKTSDSESLNSENLNEIQSTEKPHKCTYANCKKSFKTSSKRARHVRTHLKLKPYKCDICEREFSDSMNLKRHLLIHTGEKHFSCRECNQKFRLKHHLQLHIMSKHKEVSKSDEPDETQNLDESKSLYEIQTLDEPQTLHEIKTLGELQTPYETQTPYEPQTLHENKILYEIQTLHEPQTLYESLAEVKTLDEAQTPHETETLYETATLYETLNEVKILDETQTLDGTQISHEAKSLYEIKTLHETETLYETLVEVKTLDETETPNETKTLDETQTPYDTETLYEIKTLHENTTLYETRTLVEIETPGEPQTINETQTLDKIQAVDETQATEKRYKCTFSNCNKSFEFRSSLTRHVCSHLNIKPYGCEICQKRFIESGKLKKHMLIHTGEKPFSCDECNQRFRAKSHLRLHVIGKHGAVLDKPYECEICQKRFIESGKLKKHMLVHTGRKPFSCQECNQMFRLKRHLQTHIISQHKKAAKSEDLNETEKLYKCTYASCKKSFCNLSNFTNHFRKHLLNTTHKKRYSDSENFLVYTDENSFSCNVCNKKFKQKKYLERHVNSKHNSPIEADQDETQTTDNTQTVNETQTTEKRHKCTFSNCNKSFEASCSLTRHVRSHLNIKPYECKSCKKRFTDSSNLKQHTLIHTGEKPFSCDICNEKFRRKQHLQLHTKNKHSEISETDHPDEKKSTKSELLNEADFKELLTEKVVKLENVNETQITEEFFKCIYADCKEMFETTSQLADHVRSHSQPILCQYKTCGRQFSDSANLNTHLLLHTDEKRFACDICNQNFRLKHHLKLHMNSKHPEVSESDKPDVEIVKSENVDETQETKGFFKCGHANCKKTFKASSDLTRHVKTHLQTKCHTCETCGRVFSDYMNLKRHLLIHTGEKPFSCDLCDQKFRRKHHLQLHLSSKH